MTAGLLLLAAAGLVGGVAWASQPRTWGVWVVGSLAAALGAALTVLTGGSAWEWRGGWPVGGEVTHLRLDGLSAFFLALVAVVGAAGTVYSSEYWPDRVHPRQAPWGRRAWSLMLLSMGLVLVASHGLHFLIAWEFFALSGYFLIVLEAGRPAVRAAGWLYLAASHAGTLLLWAFFSGWAARTGSWDLGPLEATAGGAGLYWLALAGFGIKAGLFPLHVWLPSAHAHAPSHVSALLSGVAIKMGVYGLVRFGGWFPVPVAAGWTVVALGLASAVLGVVFALGQHDLKRLLAYHSVENLGIILLGVGFALVARRLGAEGWGALALAGGLWHVWNHGLFKSLLFLGAGSVLHATGTREMSRLGGLWRGMPWTTALFTLGAVAIAGLPPLNGFVSEWLVYGGLLTALTSTGGAVAPAAVAALILLAMTGALALACFVKVCGVVFLGAPRTPAAARAHEGGGAMRAGMLLPAIGCVAIGLAPVWFWPGVHQAVAAWCPEWAATPRPESLAVLTAAHGVLALGLVGAAWGLWRRVHRGPVARGLTWDCGYAAPTPRMQYTAGSFAAIITGWFDWILRPERHGTLPAGYFPTQARYETHTPETVLDRVLTPVARGVMWLAHLARRLQHGRIQAYVLYVVLGVAVVAGVALLGSP